MANGDHNAQSTSCSCYPAALFSTTANANYYSAVLCDKNIKTPTLLVTAGAVSPPAMLMNQYQMYVTEWRLPNATSSTMSILYSTYVSDYFTAPGVTAPTVSAAQQLIPDSSCLPASATGVCNKVFLINYADSTGQSGADAVAKIQIGAGGSVENLIPSQFPMSSPASPTGVVMDPFGNVIMVASMSSMTAASGMYTLGDSPSLSVTSYVNTAFNLTTSGQDIYFGKLFYFEGLGAGSCFFYFLGFLFSFFMWMVFHVIHN